MSTRTWISSSSTDFAVAANWTGTTVPVAGDTVIFSNAGTANVDTNLNQSALTGMTVLVYQSYTGKIGSDAGAPLQIGATSAQIGLGNNGTLTSNGSGRLNFDFGSSNVTVIVTTTSSNSSDAALAPFRFKGGGASSKLIVYGGIVDVATNTVGDTATLASVDILQGTSSPTVFLAAGCTLTTVNQSAGTLTVNSAVTTFTQSAGTATFQGAGAVTTMNVSGIVYYNSTGTITTASVFNGGTLSFARDSQAKTVTNAIKAYPGCTVNVDNGSKGSITHTLTLQGCRLINLTYTTWLSNTITLS
jgi:hypothetical protein